MVDFADMFQARKAQWPNKTVTHSLIYSPSHSVDELLIGFKNGDDDLFGANLYPVFVGHCRLRLGTF